MGHEYMNTRVDDHRNALGGAWMLVLGHVGRCCLG